MNKKDLVKVVLSGAGGALGFMIAASILAYVADKARRDAIA